MSDAVQPFRIQTSDDALDDLRRRLRATRFPEAELVSDWSQGIPLAYVKEVCAYWAEKYDWRERERKLNAFPQFRTDVEGQGIHFYHVRSKHADALPIVITHGWPGSVVEFQKVIAPLADPTAHGGDAADAFHVVCPSLPGYASRQADPGTGVERIADPGRADDPARLPALCRAGRRWVRWSRRDRPARPRTARDPPNMPDRRARSGDDEQPHAAEQSALAGMATASGIGYSSSRARGRRPRLRPVDSPAGQARESSRSSGNGPTATAIPRTRLARRLLDNVMFYWVPSRAPRRRGSTGRASARSRRAVSRTSPCRPAAASSRRRSSARRGAGPRSASRSSSTGTSCRRAATSRRSSSPRRS